MPQMFHGRVSSSAGLLESQNVPFPQAVARLQTLEADRNCVRA